MTTIPKTVPPAKVYITSSFTRRQQPGTKQVIKYTGKLSPQTGTVWICTPASWMKTGKYGYRLLGSNNEEWSSPSGNHLVSTPISTKVPTVWSKNRRLERSNGVNPLYFVLLSALLLENILVSHFCSAAHGWHHLLAGKKNQKTSGMKQRWNKRFPNRRWWPWAQMNPHFIFNCLNAIDNPPKPIKRKSYHLPCGGLPELSGMCSKAPSTTWSPFIERFLKARNCTCKWNSSAATNKFSYELTASDELCTAILKPTPYHSAIRGKCHPSRPAQ